jgi:hypothetical protein
MRHRLNGDHSGMSLQIVLALVVCVTALMLISARSLREWQLGRRSGLDLAALEALGTELLEYVKAETLGARPVVELAPFWAPRSLSAADRHAVQLPLQRAGVLIAAHHHDTVVEKTLARLADWAFLSVPERVVLRTHERELMVNAGMPASAIVAELLGEFRRDV